MIIHLNEGVSATKGMWEVPSCILMKTGRKFCDLRYYTLSTLQN